MASPHFNRPYTLITGASSGLGKALAFECAKRGQNLLLVALPKDGLTKVDKELKERYPVRIQSVELDLTHEDAIPDLMNFVPQDGINCLINNVGIGGGMNFQDATINYLNNMIDLNIRTTALLTYYLLPELQRHRDAQIINISSLISQYPAPFKTLYPASKAFVYTFSKGLREELKESLVGVTVVLPGPMITNSDVLNRIGRQGRLAKVALLSTEEVAKIIMKGSSQNRSVIIPGFMNKFYWFLLKFFPYKLVMAVVYKVFKKERNSVTSKIPGIKVELTEYEARTIKTVK